MSDKTKVFALIVGINDYPSAPLTGCVPDAKRIEAYLKSRADLDIPEQNISLLLNEQATKEKIVEGFRNHLSKAGADDVALFYFSGHGAQEFADAKVWINELDGLIECIACYNSSGVSLMADKELRYLIHELSSKSENGMPHILTIFDCCHSGDNTRSVATVASEEEQTRERRFQNAFPQRAWEDFLFSHHIKTSSFARASMKELLPQGAHINLSAAQDKQPALEIGNAGLFTQKLLQVLKASGGNIDYVSLHSLVSNYIRFKYKQIPQLAVQGGSTDLLYTGFLNQAVEYKGELFGEVSYNMAKGWLLNMGQMHGLSVGDPVSIHLKDDQIIEVSIDQIYTSTSEVAIERSLRQQMDKEQYYKAQVSAYSSYPLAIYINDCEGDQDALAKLKEAIQALHAPVQIAESEASAEYTLHLNYDLIFITESFDSYRPVLGVITASEEDWINRIISQVQQIAKWEFARKLHNSNVKALRKPPLTINVQQRKGGVMVPVETKYNEYFIDEVHWEADAAKYRGYIKISITNNFNRPLYFCMLELTEGRESNISIDTDEVYGLVEKAVMELKPNATYQVFQHFDPEIPFKVEEKALRFNKPHSTTWFKFLVSTKDDIAYQHLIIPTSRSAVDMPKKNVDDWTTQMIAIQLKNPRHNQVVESEVAAYFSDETMAPFAAGLYLSTDALKSELKLKESIVPVVPGGNEQIAQRNFFWNTLLGAANKWAQNSRLRTFKKQVEKYPARPLIVSEGDSWFQHPTVTEIIDHLSLYYNIYSRGAAGDEMREYLMTGDFQQSIEDIVKAYPDHPVRFFLISGGGNDILGEQFKEFIYPYDQVVTRDEGVECGRFLNDRFYDELDAVTKLYDMVLRRINTAFPDIQVLTHGYDYAWPKGVNEKGMSWLGAPMTAAGILRQGDRKGIVDYLIDEFNKHMIEVVAQHANATHIDLRGSVKKYQWYDEIHPNKEGYQNIALRYMELIDHVL